MYHVEYYVNKYTAYPQWNIHQQYKGTVDMLINL